ncbi:MAG: ATP-dependent DNA helicase [Candidatus Bruticola sp.]
MTTANNIDIQEYLSEVERVFTELIPSCLGYSVRSEQIKMALAAAEAIAGGKVLLAQAGTGVGKTLAYLVPGVIWRLRYGAGPILVATYTTNLQQQIFDKDYPFMRDRLGFSFRLVQALGRTRYLCLMRFYRLLKHIHQYPQYALLLEAINDCIEMGNYSLFHPELQEEAITLRGLAADFRRMTKNICSWDDSIWQHICAESINCTKRSCRYFHNCYFYKERAQLAGADVCIANHALLCALLRQDGINRLLPQLSACIIDEAHHFEDVAIEQMSSSFDFAYNSKFFDGFAKVSDKFVGHFNEDNGEEPFEDNDRGGLFGETFVQVPSLRSSEANKRTFPSGWFCDIAEAVQRLSNRLSYGSESDFFRSLSSFYRGPFQALYESVTPYLHNLEDYYENKAYCSLECFERGSRLAMLNEKWLSGAGIWGEKLVDSAQSIKEVGNSCIAQLRELESLWKDAAEGAEIGSSEDQPSVLIASALEQINEFMNNFHNCHDIDDSQALVGHWMEKSKRGVRLRAAFADVSEYLADAFWKQMPAAVAASATLKVDSSFDFFSCRVGIDKLEEDRVRKLTCSSPFSYRSQALLAVAGDLGRSGASESADDSFLPCAVRFITEVAKLWQGRTLVLATSRYEVEKIYETIHELLAELGITLLKQSSNLRADQVERMRCARQHGEKIVLIGTDSFWEGVDVSGEALSCVIMLRLPFTSPDNPLFKIRSRHIGRQAFMKYALPMAVLKFRQGFGRLVRTESDRGVVFVLDNRLDREKGKGYRYNFLKSLPNCPIIYDKSEELLRQAFYWFRTGRLLV